MFKNINNMRKLINTTLAISILFAACSPKLNSSKSTKGSKVAPKATPDRHIPGEKQYVKRATIIDSTRVGHSGTPGKNNNGINQNREITDSYNNQNVQKTATENAVTADSLAAIEAAKNYLSEPAVVIDSRGHLMIDTLNLPPTVSHNLDSLNQSIRAFTPDQAKNLAYRFKQIPPRVLYVPDSLAKKGRKGFYYKYNNKFWYWKKADGYFYLDENYYK